MDSSEVDAEARTMISIIIPLVLVVVIILLLFVIISAFFFAIDFFLDLPYVATKKEKIDTIIKFANIKSGETVVDLGSGDGRLLFAAARKGVRAIGYEINPFLVFLTRVKTRFLHLRGEARPMTRKHLGGGQIIIKHQNLWQADLSQADAIFVYGRRNTMQKFQDFVYKNAKKGTRVVVNTDKTIPFPTKKPTKSENQIFLYKI